MAVETPNSDDRVAPASAAKTGWQQLYRTEDWWAVWIGGALLALCTIFVWHGMASGEKGGELLKAWLAKPGSWKANPLDAFTVKGANVVGGAWLGGTIDSTGAVAAAVLPTKPSWLPAYVVSNPPGTGRFDESVLPANRMLSSASAVTA
jgi:hypothetical protein